MLSLKNENLLTLIFTSFTLKANNNISSGIKNKTISKAILVLADYKKIYKSIELEIVMSKSGKEFLKIALLPNGGIVSASDNGALKLWNINDNSCKLLEIEQFVNHLLRLPDGKFASCYDDNNYINIWEMKADSETECIKSIVYEGCKEIIKLFLLSDLNIACSAKFGESFRILILDSKNEYNCIQNLSGHAGVVRALVSLQSDRIASGSDDTTIKVWDLDQGICLKTLTEHKHCINSLIFIERHNTLVSASYDEPIKIWEVNDFHCLKTIQVEYGIRSLLLLPGGYFATGGYNNIKIWDTNNYECIHTLGNQKGHVNHLVLMKDRIVSIFNEHYDTLVVWKFDHISAKI
jgi:WD40 repeat protein